MNQLDPDPLPARFREDLGGTFMSRRPLGDLKVRPPLERPEDDMAAIVQPDVAGAEYRYSQARETEVDRIPYSVSNYGDARVIAIACLRQPTVASPLQQGPLLVDDFETPFDAPPPTAGAEVGAVGSVDFARLSNQHHIRTLRGQVYITIKWRGDVLRHWHLRKFTSLRIHAKQRVRWPMPIPRCQEEGPGSIAVREKAKIVPPPEAARSDLAIRTIRLNHAESPSPTVKNREAPPPVVVTGISTTT